MSRPNCCNSENYDSDNCICLICHEPSNDSSVKINCGGDHYFHTKCIETYINVLNQQFKSIICPTCRRDFTKYIDCNGKQHNVGDVHGAPMPSGTEGDDYDVSSDDESNYTPYQRSNMNMYNQTMPYNYRQRERGGKKYKKYTRKNKRKSGKSRKYKKYNSKSRRYRNKSRKYHKR